MSDGVAHEVLGPDDKQRATAVEAPQWPNAAAVLEALAALEAEFNAILKPGAAAPK